MGNLLSYYGQILFLTLIITNHLWEIYLARRQSLFLLKNRFYIPSLFSEKITSSEHQKSTLYSLDRLSFSQFKLVYQLILYLYWFPFRGAENLYLKTSNFTLGGDLLFLMMFSLIQALLFFPFSYYSTFIIENKFGFNRTTKKTFFLDLLKGFLLSTLLLVPFTFLLLLTMDYFSNYWWLIAFSITALFQLFIAWIYPILIAPLFNKFTPLDEGPLKIRIKKLLSDVDLLAEEVLVMDASQRSSHGNAYFTGFGKNKRVVFFDTLLEKLNEDEVIAVLAHELGHLKLRHIPLQITISLCITFISFITLFFLSQYDWIYSAHFMRINSNGVMLFLLAYAFSIYTFWPSIFFSVLSRRNEFSADHFATRFSDKDHLISALIKLYKYNSSPLASDKWYSFFYYSHPTPEKRISRLQASPHSQDQ